MLIVGRARWFRLKWVRKPLPRGLRQTDIWIGWLKIVHIPRAHCGR